MGSRWLGGRERGSSGGVVGVVLSRALVSDFRRASVVGSGYELSGAGS